MTDPRSAVKEKIMKEKSRTAAKSRRERENIELESLGRILPLPPAIGAQLDKGAVIRLSASFLKLRNLFSESQWEAISGLDAGLKNWSPRLRDEASFWMQTLDGFLFVSDPSGKIMYISETASVHLGMSQVEYTGNNIFDHLHPDDSEEFHAILGHTVDRNFCAFNQIEMDWAHMFTLRIRCVLTKRNAGLTVDGYKIIHCIGHARMRRSLEISTGAETGNFVTKILFAFGTPLPCSSVTEVKLSQHVFMFRASADLKLVFLDCIAQNVLGYGISSLLDCSWYKFIHPDDVRIVQEAHRIVLKKKQAISKSYRILLANGTAIRHIISQMAMVHNVRTSRPVCIVAMNHVITEPICEGSVSRSALKNESHVVAAVGNPANDLRNPENDVEQTLGAYSEQFYGRHGSLLMQNSMAFAGTSTFFEIQSRAMYENDEEDEGN